MLQKLKTFLGRTYTPLNKIEISSLFLLHNYNYLSNLSPAIKVAPVLKSNAYGHGIEPMAKLCDRLGAPFLCVDSIYEGYELLKAGVRTPILIMGYIDPQNLKVKKLPFSYAVYSKEQLEAINTYQKGAGIHIKFDSGMHRLGVTFEEFSDFLHTIKTYKHVRIEGFMSHFAESEHPESDLTKLQISNIRKALDTAANEGINFPWRHIANSGGLLNHAKLNLGTISNMARTGLALYGIDSRGEGNNTLKPLLRLTTKIVQIKYLKAGDKVGYNGTFIAKRDTTLAILPIGYYDGVDRRLSNKGSMLVDGQVCPILGRVSMNITTIDVSAVEKPFVGQEVLIYSDDPKDDNSIQQSAKTADTIPYDLLVHLAASTRREVK